MPDSFANLKFLKSLTIANDGREHEKVDNPNRNTIYFWNEQVFNRLLNLEEINMQHLGMRGKLTNSLVSLHKLKYLNLGYNLLQGPLTDSSEWVFLRDIEFIELQSNRISGPVPNYWKYLPKLEYVDVSYNNFTGRIPIFEAAQEIKGLEFSDNLFSGSYPIEYFAKDRFKKLEYINANFNAEVVVPEFCIRYAFCFKSKSEISNLSL